MSPNHEVFSRQMWTRQNSIQILYNNPFSRLHILIPINSILIAETRLELIQLPDDELDTFPSLEIRTYSQPDEEDPSDEDRKLAIDNFHKHPLILVGDEEDNDYKKLVCDICIQTITIPSPFYRCAQQSEGCSFLAHKVCSELLPILKLRNHILGVSTLCPDPAKWFYNSIFYCIFCCLPCNGPCYYFPSSSILINDDIPMMIDLSCMAAPSIIKHSSHSQHILFRTSRYLLTSPITCCSRGSTIHDVYMYTTCNFYIHIRCALLPKRV